MMSKRKRFIITSTVLALGFVGIQFLSDSVKFYGIGLLSLITALLFIWSLREGLALNFSLTVLILPVLFTLGVGLFWFLLPSTVYARIPIIIFYSLGIYALCLTHNIYTVAAIRTIALLRSARGVGFVLSLVTAFLLFDAILSIRPNPLVLVITSFVSSYLIFFQGLWGVILVERPNRALWLLSLICTLATTEIALSLFFWPVTVVVGSIFLTVFIYVLLGLAQAKLEERLFSQTIREYLTVGIFVFLGMLIATRWGF